MQVCSFCKMGEVIFGSLPAPAMPNDFTGRCNRCYRYVERDTALKASLKKVEKRNPVPQKTKQKLVDQEQLFLFDSTDHITLNGRPLKKE